MAQKKSGTAMNRNCISAMMRSDGCPRWIAAYTPQTIPMIVTSTKLIPARMAERPSASRITGRAGRSITSERPKSPCSIWQNQCQYCNGSGSLSPSFCSNVAIASGVANSPRIA